MNNHDPRTTNHVSAFCILTRKSVSSAPSYTCVFYIHIFSWPYHLANDAWTQLSPKVWLEGKKQEGEISDKSVLACSSGVRLPWTPGVEGECGHLGFHMQQVRYKCTQAHPGIEQSWTGWTSGFTSELESLVSDSIWEQEHLPPELRWCLELGNKGYVMVCSKIVFMFWTFAQVQSRVRSEHCTLDPLHAPGFGECGSQGRKWKNCGTEMSAFLEEYKPKSI